MKRIHRYIYSEYIPHAMSPLPTNAILGTLSLQLFCLRSFLSSRFHFVIFYDPGPYSGLFRSYLPSHGSFFLLSFSAFSSGWLMLVYDGRRAPALVHSLSITTIFPLTFTFIDGVPSTNTLRIPADT